MRCLLWLAVSVWPPVLSRPNFSSDFMFTESLSPHHVRVHIYVKIRSPPQWYSVGCCPHCFSETRSLLGLELTYSTGLAAYKTPGSQGGCPCPSPSVMMAGLCHGSGNGPWVLILAHKHLANWALSPPTSPSSAILFSVISLVRLTFLHTIVPIKEFVSLDSKTEGKSHSIPYSHWHRKWSIEKIQEENG